MFTNLDQNDYYLREYEYHQDLLEEQYLISLDEKKEEIEMYASEILKGYVSEDDFHLAFSEYWDDEKQEYSPFLTATLDEWNLMELSDENICLMESFARNALEASCEIIMGDNLYTVASEGAWNTKRMINDLVGEV